MMPKLGKPHKITFRHIYSRLRYDNDTGCWIWTGGQTPGGYGNQTYQGEKQIVHRLTFARCVRQLQVGQEVHHTCGNKLCANPAHLRAMTKEAHEQEHVKTHCPNGHPYTAGNVYEYEYGRRCRECCLEYSAWRYINAKNEAR